MKSALKRIGILREGIQSLAIKLEEKFAIQDLGTHAVSGITDDALDTRLGEPYTNKEILLRSTVWDTRNDTLLLRFMAKPTYTNKTPFVITNRGNKGARVFYNYEVMLQYVNVSKFLGTMDVYAKLKVKDKIAKMKDLIWKDECRVHSNDPSFYYQGMWEDLAKVDGTIYKFPGPTGTGLWRTRHNASGGLSVPEIRITKHIAQIIQEINDWIVDAVNGLQLK
jgi:hypothetical protein